MPKLSKTGDGKIPPGAHDEASLSAECEPDKGATLLKSSSSPSIAAAILNQLSDSSTSDGVCPSAKKQRNILQLKKQAQDYNRFCRSHCKETDYYTLRGFSGEMIRRFCLGYDPKKRVAVIPFSICYYLGRRVDVPIDSTSTGKFVRPHGLRRPLFNLGALTTGRDVCTFLTESPFDAISLIQSGANALALGGTSTGFFSETLDDAKPECCFILAFGNTRARQRLRAEVEALLQERHLSYSLPVHPVFFLHKDANAALCANPSALVQAIDFEQARLSIRTSAPTCKRERLLGRAPFAEGADERVMGARSDSPALRAPFDEGGVA